MSGPWIRLSNGRRSRSSDSGPILNGHRDTVIRHELDSIDVDQIDPFVPYAPVVIYEALGRFPIAMARQVLAPCGLAWFLPTETIISQRMRSDGPSFGTRPPPLSAVNRWRAPFAETWNVSRTVPGVRPTHLLDLDADRAWLAARVRPGGPGRLTPAGRRTPPRAQDDGERRAFHLMENGNA